MSIAADGTRLKVRPRDSRFEGFAIDLLSGTERLRSGDDSSSGEHGRAFRGASRHGEGHGLTPSPGALVKLRLSGPDGQVETPWAELLEGGALRLDNSPFFADGVSLDDVVEVAETETADVFEFVRVIRPSGNRTVRICFLDYASSDARAQRILEQLVDCGCDYEGMAPRLVSVNVPSEVDLGAVARLLTDADLMWEHANPTYEALHGL